MSTTYDGDETNYPLSITIPSDGDGPGISAADVNVAFEALADRTARNARNVGMVRTVYTAAGPTVWTPPHAGITHVFLQMCGGGGGGGKGATGENATNRWVCGGGGGAGAQLVTAIVPVTFGVNYNVYVGAGGAVGLNGAKAKNGAVSEFGIASGDTLVAAFGGGGGWGAMDSDYAVSTTLILTLGGSSDTTGATNDEDNYLGWGFWGEIRNEISANYGASGARSLGLSQRHGDGGPGVVANGTNYRASETAFPGRPARVSLVSTLSYGGAGGAAGSDDSSYRGGGGGGGGGGGPWGAGGAGGAGGPGAVSGGAGVAGTAAAANTGAGGGGGGAGGGGVAGGAGAVAGAGGSGRVELFYWGQP